MSVKQAKTELLAAAVEAEKIQVVHDGTNKLRINNCIWVGDRVRSLTAGELAECSGYVRPQLSRILVVEIAVGVVGPFVLLYLVASCWEQTRDRGSASDVVALGGTGLWRRRSGASWMTPTTNNHPSPPSLLPVGWTFPLFRPFCD